MDEVKARPDVPLETLTLPDEQSDDNGSALWPGDRERYVLLREHGRGGLGRVLLAHDQALDRQVAIKISISDSPDAQARFAQEAHITARLQHPGIVPVHDAGVWSNGQPYCAMKFIAGRSLRDLLEELEDDFEGRLALLPKLVAVAEALAYAHDQGIVHRDIKPSNIMVGDFGETIIVDWGIAVDASDNRESEPGQSPERAAGTRGYMAPEQARGEAANASADVFSLGVVLYETLAGRSLDRTSGDLRVVEPRVPAELAAIVTRATAEEPARRYSDASELGHDLGAYLDGQLVRAHRYTWRQRTWRRIRRHRSLLLSALVLVLAATTVFGIVHARAAHPTCDVSPAELASVWDAPTRARVAATFAAMAQPAGSDAFTRIAKLLDDKREKWMKMRRETCEATHIRGTQSQRTFDIRTACLDRRRGEMAALTARLASGTPAAKPTSSLAAALRLPPVSACADTAALQSTSPPPTDPKKRARAQTLRAKLDDAQILWSLGADKDASKALEALDKPVHALGYAPLLADLLSLRGYVSEDLGDFPAARAAYEEGAIEAARGGDKLAVARNEIALVILVTDRLRDPKLAKRLRPMAEASVALVPFDTVTQAKWHQAVGVMKWTTADYAGAIAEDEKALAIEMRLPERNHYWETGIFTDLGLAHRGNHDYAEAEKYYLRALDMCESLFGSNNLNSVSILNNLGVLEDHQGNFQKALEYDQRALKLKRAAYGDVHPSVAKSLSNIGGVYMDLGNLEEASRYFEQALEVREKALGPDHPAVAVDLDNMGTVYMMKSEYTKAHDMFLRTLDLRRSHVDEGDISLASPLMNLGLSERALGHYEQSVKHCREALEIRTRLNKPGRAIAQVQLCVARTLLLMGQPRKAVKLLSSAVKQYETTEPIPSRLNRARFDLGRTLFKLGHKKQGLALALKAREAMAKADPKADELIEFDEWLKEHAH